MLLDGLSLRNSLVSDIPNFEVDATHWETGENSCSSIHEHFETLKPLYLYNI